LIYDGSLIQIDESVEGITGGLIGSTKIPCDGYSANTQGVKLIGHIPMAGSASGSGYLAEIHFKVIAATGTISISFAENSRNLLYNNLGKPMEVSLPTAPLEISIVQ